MPKRPSAQAAAAVVLATTVGSFNDLSRRRRTSTSAQPRLGAITHRPVPLSISPAIATPTAARLLGSTPLALTALVASFAASWIDFPGSPRRAGVERV